MSDTSTLAFLRFRDAGDQDALAAAFDLTAPILLRLGRHLLGDAAAAEDALQETFLVAIRRARDLRDDAPLRPWLAGILLRYALNERRRRRRHAAALDRAATARRATPPESRPEDAAALIDVLALVEDGLRSIGSPYREVVEANLFGEAQPAEVARSLGRRAGLVRVQLHRGLERLRAVLPRGAFALGGAPRGLDGVRSAILRDAARSRSVAAIQGSAAIGKAVAVAAGAAILAVAAWLMLESPRDPAGARSERSLALFALRAKDGIEITRRNAPAADPVASGQVWLEPLPRGAVRPVLVLRGRVVSAFDGRPVEGARIRCATHGDEPFALATSGPDGSFRMDATEPSGSARDLEVFAPGFGVLNESFDLRLRDAVPIAGGFDLGDVALEAGEAIEGIVRSATGAPVPGARVFAETGDDELGLFRLDSVALAAITDAAGRFRIDHAGGSSTATLCAATDRGLAITQVNVPRGVGVTRDVELLVVPTASVTVTVVDAAGAPVADAVVVAEPRFEPWTFIDGRSDANGRYVPHPPVHGLDLGTEPEISGTFRAVTDPTGRAVLARLPAPAPSGWGDPLYDVYVIGAGLEPAWVDGVSLAPSTNVEIPISVGPLRRLRVEGTVVDGTRLPLAGIEVALESRRARQVDAYPRIVTNSEGRFVFEPLPSDRAFGVIARGLRCQSARAEVKFVPGQDVAIVELVLDRPAFPLAGRLLESNGVPVPFAFLTVEGTLEGDRFCGTMTDATGAFEIESPKDGELTLSCSAFRTPGRWKHPEPEWTVRAGDRDLVLYVERLERPACRFAASVVDAGDGTPLEVMEARLRPDPSDAHAPALEPAVGIGTIECGGVAAGRWILDVRVKGRVSITHPVEIAVGAVRHEVRVEVPRMAVVRLSVKADGAPDESWWIVADRAILTEWQDEISVGSFVDVARESELRTLPGPLELRVGTRGWSGAKRVEVPADGIVDVVIDAVRDDDG